MNRLEMIYQDEYIEIYIKEDLIFTQFYMSNHYKVLARYYGHSVNKNMIIEVKSVRFEDLKKFHEVVVDYITKAL